MELRGKTGYYLVALFVAFIWSVTFVFTKVLLDDLTPFEILFYRYVVAYLVLVVAYPKFEKPKSVKEEIKFALAGLLGVTLYFLGENYALSYSTASNVALLVVIAPLITGIFAHFLTKGEPITRNFAVGGVVAMAGVFLVIFNGHFVLKLHPIGDMLAIGAAVSFAFYSIILKNMDKSYSAVFITRRSFFYALLAMVPMLFTPMFAWKPEVLVRPAIFANLAFLSVIASSLCFMLWNKVIWRLGAVKANNILYLVPLMTMIASAIVLSERITVFAIAGAVLILGGVYISQK
ncbi:DMT family transporter [Synergistaceae bacterium OttesenSCG-928-D05]|nr:DMT family transporter [Synergistaceae bacterium OttesenSCG-928-D05]